MILTRGEHRSPHAWLYSRGKLDLVSLNSDVHDMI